MKLVIADDHKGLRAAASRVFNATQQRCRIDWMRSALAHAPTKQRAAVAAMLKTIFAQETKAGAETRWEIVADALRERQPRLGALMDSSRDDVLAYISRPREHWAQIASTNPLERVNRDVKRRPDMIGIFPNDEAIIRLVGASAMRLGPCVGGSRGARALFGSGIWSVAAMCTASELQHGGCAP